MAGLWQTGPTRRNESAAVYGYRRARSKIRAVRASPQVLQTGSDIMVHAIRIHQTGGPEVMKWESVEVPAPGPGPGAAQAACAWASTTSTSISAPASTRCRLPFVAGSEGVGRGGGRRPRRDGLQGRRPRRLRRRARRLCRGAGDARRPAGQAARQHRLQDRRGHDAAGHDGALSAARRPTRSARARPCCCMRPPAASA